MRGGRWYGKAEQHQDCHRTKEAVATPDCAVGRMVKERQDYFGGKRDASEPTKTTAGMWLYSDCLQQDRQGCDSECRI